MIANLQEDMLSERYTLRLTAEQLAEVFGVSRPRIYQLRDAGMPMESRNCYDLGACVRWRIEQAEAKAESAPANEDSTRSLLNIAQREKVELEIAKERRQLVPAAWVVSMANAIATILATYLDGVSPRVAAEVADIDEPAEVQRVLFAEHRQIRESIAKDILRKARDIGSDLDGFEPMPSKPKRARRTTKKKTARKGAT